MYGGWTLTSPLGNHVFTLSLPAKLTFLEYLHMQGTNLGTWYILTHVTFKLPYEVCSIHIPIWFDEEIEAQFQLVTMAVIAERGLSLGSSESRVILNHSTKSLMIGIKWNFQQNTQVLITSESN